MVITSSILVHNYEHHSDGHFELRVLDMDAAPDSDVASSALARNGDLFD